MAKMLVWMLGLALWAGPAAANSIPATGTTVLDLLIKGDLQNAGVSLELGGGVTQDASGSLLIPITNVSEMAIEHEGSLIAFQQGALRVELANLVTTDPETNPRLRADVRILDGSSELFSFDRFPLTRRYEPLGEGYELDFGEDGAWLFNHLKGLDFAKGDVLGVLQIEQSAVPEPGLAMLMGMSVVGLVWAGRRRA